MLFADVVHSMDIAAAVGPERLREIMAGLLDRAAAVMARHGGTVDKFTGDGVMAVFGAPAALEDHAVRACRAALDLQSVIGDLAEEVSRQDDAELQLRIGLNSGQVIVGEIGSGGAGYTAIGEQVGMAQRMESAAPPGGVMLSASTARLVDHVATLGEPSPVRIKGSDHPVTGYVLQGLPDGARLTPHRESALVGRRREMTAVEGLLKRAAGGEGAIVTLVGPPGIGKSRVVREACAMAPVHGFDVISSYCESHTADIPFHVVARLLRAATGVSGLDGSSARARIRDRTAGADPEDVVLLEDLLGIADSDAVLPRIDPDARRRRLTALINAASLARETPVVYVIEDVHWIDKVSESMLADFLSVIPQTPSLVLITYRPEYTGALSRLPGAHNLDLAPLSDAETAALVGGLLGPDASVSEVAALITEKAAGNPFFAEEMVRDLAERWVLSGRRTAYTSATGVGEVALPATVQATIAARIDRLDPAAKRALSAAAVVGAKFSRDMLTALGVDPVLDILLSGHFIDQVGFSADPQYVFHHPLIRTVAYESQLKSDRAELHRRVAAVVESGDPAAAEENAALIAEHLEAAGDLTASYGWRMRAAAWARGRDINAARSSWERARVIADAQPVGVANHAAMRIAPRTMLCATAYRVRATVVDPHFDELRQLCTAAGDKASLAIAMSGMVMDHAYQGRIREASLLASEARVLIESVGDPTVTVGLSYPGIYAKVERGEWPVVLQWSQTAIDLAEGDPYRGNFIFGSPLALALTSRAMARYCLGRAGWREDIRDGLAMARSVDPLTYAAVVALSSFPEIQNGALVADDHIVREIEDAVEIAERAGNDMALSFARLALGMALVHRETEADRDRGQALLADVSTVFEQQRHNLCEKPLVDVYVAREMARRGDLQDAIGLMRVAVDHLIRAGQLLAWGTPATGVLVQTLLDRGMDADVAEAESAIDRLAMEPAEGGLAIRDVWVLRLRALSARARGDASDYTGLLARYRDAARKCGYEGHIAWAEAMTRGGGGAGGAF